MKNQFLRVFGLLLSLMSHAFAQDVLPGFIPRFYAIEAATDLPYTPDRAHAMALQGQDISLLDPTTMTNIWRPNQNAIPAQRLLAPNERVRYGRELPSRDGQLRFSVVSSNNRELIVILSKKAHNFLLRRNILAKLGYSTQPMSWTPSLQLEFADTIDRDLFKEEMRDKLLAGTDRWIRSQRDLTIVLQDVLVLTPDTDIYNLATGVMAPEIHQGRRLLRSPYVPLALVDTTESVNLMPWQAGRVVLNNLKLYHTQDLDDGYGTSWEDARWIGRRIGRLTRADLAEVVVKAHYPAPVEKLLVEKIVARRNDLMTLLQLETDFPALPFNPDIGMPPGLLNGEIVQEFFPGYASRFSYGDPESPFSASELGSYALGRLRSQLLDLGVRGFNELLRTQDENNYRSEVEKLIRKEGEFFSTRAVAIPTLNGQLILSRDIVTGTYMGTNNKVQLVDNFGFSLDAGFFAGVEGLPVPVQLTARGGVSFQRTFSHVKPIQTLRRSLREPYKNLAVPMLFKDLGRKIDRLTSEGGAENQALVQSVLSDLKGAMGVGESFIITDSLVPRLIGEAEMSLTQFTSLPERLLRVYAGAQAARMILTRFHLHRADEHTFHVYQDYGKNLKLMVTLKLKSYVPLLSFNARWNQATAETHFYPVSLHPRDVNVTALKALRMSIFSLNHSALQEVVRPHKVENVIKERGQTFQFLIFKQNRLGSLQDMKLTHANGGAVKEIFRRYDAHTEGTDTESYVTEAVNELINAFADARVRLSDVMTLNSGFTVGGRAKNRVFTSEHDGSRLTMTYERIMNGWKIPARQIRGLLEQVNREAGRRIFDPLMVINANSILLYQVSFFYTLTQEGVTRLLASTDSQVRAALRGNVYRDNTHERLGDERDIVRDLRRIQRLMAQPDPSDGMKELHTFLKNFHSSVSVRGLEALVGTENIAYQGRIEGYRQGDEAGDSPVFSNVYGELPVQLHTAPTQQVMQSWGILEGELLSNWMMERAI